MTPQQEQETKDDIAEFEKVTSRPFRTAHPWDNKKGFYTHIVTSADVGKK